MHDINNFEYVEECDRNVLAGYVIWLVLGIAGVHKMYCKRYTSYILQDNYRLWMIGD